MKWSNCEKMRMLLVGFVAAVVLGSGSWVGIGFGLERLLMVAEKRQRLG